MATIGPLAWEPPNAVGVALKKKKTKNKCWKLKLSGASWLVSPSLCLEGDILIPQGEDIGV